MTYKTIPANADLIQEGLFLYTYEKTIGGKPYTFRHLYSSSGYCFYDKAEEIYREKENNELVLVEDVQPNERTYYTYMSLALSKDVNDLVSVKAEPGFEIV